MTISVVAHRGNCLNDYENTLESVEAAINAGITCIEIDVQFTQDATPIVFHDADMSRITSSSQLVSDLSIHEISHINTFLASQTSSLPLRLKQKYPPKSPLKIITLQTLIHLIQQHPSVTLFVEVKTDIFANISYQKAYNRLMEVLSPALNQVVIISFSYRFLRLCKKLSSASLGYVLPEWESYSCKMLERLTPKFIFCDIEFFPENFKVKPVSLDWVLYEFSQEYDVKKYVNQGVKYFETYYPTQLLERIANNHEL